MSSSTDSNFYCSCPSGREGKLCELKRGDVCLKNPCQNGGSCKESPDGYSFFCLCRAGYRGYHCELVTDACKPNPCLHGGLCVGENPGYLFIFFDKLLIFKNLRINNNRTNICFNFRYRCSCPEGRYGRHCERSTFGFDELSYMTFPPLDANTNDIIMTFATTKPNALLLYNYGPQTGGRSDFVVLELINGKIVFSCGGARSAVTSMTVNSNRSLADGNWNKVVAIRNGNTISLSVSKCREYGDVCDECEPKDSSCYAHESRTVG